MNQETMALALQFRAVQSSKIHRQKKKGRKEGRREGRKEGGKEGRKEEANITHHKLQGLY